MIISPSKIIALVSALYAVDASDVLGANHKQHICFVRSICYYLIHEACGLTGEQIGSVFKRTKVAVNKAIKSIREQMTVDRTLRSQIERIIWILTDQTLMECEQH